MFFLGAALSSSSRLMLIKTHGTSLRRYHLWLPLPIPLALLRNYVNDKSQMQDLNMESDTESQEPDQFLNTLVRDVRNFFELNNKEDGQDKDKERSL